MANDIIEIILNSIKAIQILSIYNITFGVLVAIVIAILTWTGAIYFAKLWNKAYTRRPISYLLSGLAAIISFIYIIVFFSFSQLDTITKLYLELWSKSLKINQQWQDETFHKAFYAVKKQDPEGFIGVTTPEDGGSFIPLRNENAQLEAAYVYANQASQDFKKTYPFLSKVLFGNNTHTTKNEISSDIKRYFEQDYGNGNQDIKSEISKLLDRYAVSVDLCGLEQMEQINPNENREYKAAWAVDLASDNIRKQLEKRISRVKIMTRIGLTVVFLIIQLIPFGLIGYMAYRALKV